MDKIIIKKIFKNYLVFEKNFNQLKKISIDNFFFILINDFNRFDYEDIPLISDLVIFFVSKYDSFTIQFYETIIFLKVHVVFSGIMC